jgi:hypothetical protein
MTITFTESVVYISAVVVLIGLQIYQQILIRDLQKSIKRLWEHAATAAIMTFSRLEQLEKKDKE